MTESSTLYALLHFSTGTQQLTMYFFTLSALSAVAFPSDSVSGVWESLPTRLLFGGLKLIHI